MHAISARLAKSNVTDPTRAGTAPDATDQSNALTLLSAGVGTNYLSVVMLTVVVAVRPRELQWPRA